MRVRRVRLKLSGVNLEFSQLSSKPRQLGAIDPQAEKKSCLTEVSEQSLASDGKSIVLLARDGRVAALIALADTLRPDVSGALAALRGLGIRHFLLLTGDRPQVAQAIASPLGLEFEAGQGHRTCVIVATA